jgi:hypothetical protein
MNFIIGYTVRPKNINRLNQVIYEEYVAEALVEVLPTLDECKAYGFVFNNSDSKCYIANNPLVFNNPSATKNLSIARASNTIGRNTRDNLIAGASHILTSNNYSNVISGDNNTVTDLVSNTTISGARAEATATNSIVIGGNASNESNSTLGDELVENGDFSEIGEDEILNGDFSEIGGELVENGSFTPGIELVENGNFQDFEDATDSNLDGGVQFANWNVNPSNGLRRLTTIVDGFRNDVIEKQESTWQQRVSQSVSTDLEVGKYYRFKATFITSDGSDIRVAIQTAGSQNVQAGGYYPTEAGISQSIDIFFKCTSITSQIIDVWPRVTQEIGQGFYLQNVSLTEVGQDWNLGTGWSIGDGVASYDGTGGTSAFNQPDVIEVGKLYKISIDVLDNEGSGANTIFIGGNQINNSHLSVGTHVFYGGTTNTNVKIYIYGRSGEVFTVSNISVKEVGQDWTLGGGWSIGDGVVNAVAGSGSKLIQTNTLNGKFCKVTLTVSNYGGTSLVLVDFGSVSSSYINSNGTHTVYGAYDQNNFEIYKASGFSGDITNISVKEVGQDWSLSANASVENSELIFNANSINQYAIQSLFAAGLYDGKTLKLSYEVTENTLVGIGALRAGGFTGSSFLPSQININSDIGTHSINVIVDTVGNNNALDLWITSAYSSGSIKITNVSVAEVLPYVAKRQSIQLLYGLQSTDGSNQSSFLNGITDSLFAIPDNSVMYFHADVIAIRVGGVHATGAVGDYASWVERGVIINKSGVLSISRERDDIKSSGTVTNWQPTGIVDGTNFAMRVRGHADMTIEWASNITFTEIKTGVAL